jgi:hypothetical protein
MQSLGLLDACMQIPIACPIRLLLRMQSPRMPCAISGDCCGQRPLLRWGCALHVPLQEAVLAAVKQGPATLVQLPNGNEVRCLCSPA